MGLMEFLASAIKRLRLGLFLPSRPSRLLCHILLLHPRHGLKTALPADLTALAPYCCHVLREIHWRGWGSGQVRCGASLVD